MKFEGLMIGTVFMVLSRIGLSICMALAATTPAQVVDLSMDHVILRELLKSGVRLEPEALCVKRCKETTAIIVIGSRKSGAECEIEGAFVNDAYHEYSSELSRVALDALGWEKAGQKRREQLAMLWVEKGLLAFDTVLHTEEKDFNPYRGVTYRGGKKPDFPPFYPPKANSDSSQRVTVRLWTSFTRREKMYRHKTFQFGKDGMLLPD